MSPDWQVDEVPDLTGENVYHVMPVDDIVEHEISDECVCGPEIEFVGYEKTTGETGNGWLVVHGALDGREHTEPDHDFLHCPVCQLGRA